ncbi:MAG: kynureninase [Paracoccaceae bacterium]
MTDWTATRALFELPEGTAYLDGNSLGPLPRAARAAMTRAMEDEWGRLAIGGWNRAGWMAAPSRVGDRIGALIGAPPGTVTVGDTLSIRVWQALAAALTIRPDRRVILSDDGNFPTDLYMAQGLIETLGRGHELRVVAPDAVEDALTNEVAALLLTHVDYRTGRRHDMAALTAKAASLGVPTVWDLAHSAGAMDLDVTAAGADFAVGCTYKYLNGGPGAPAFIHVAERHLDTAPTLTGWLGHAAPFAFEPTYRPGAGIERFRIGTPAVLQTAVLDAALDVFDGVDMAALRARSVALSERLIDGVLSACPGLTLASPRDADGRGSQVSFRHPQAHAIVQALIARGVVGDFRAPDIARFGITPLYVGEAQIDAAIESFAEVMTRRLWDDPRHQARAAVT